MDKKSSQKEIRIQLLGTPEQIGPHIVRIAEDSHFQDLEYRAYEEHYKSSQSSRQFRILCGNDFSPSIRWIGGDDEVIAPQIFPKKEEGKSIHHIGTIILQPLHNNKTLFIARRISSSFDSDGSYFDSFLKTLLLELKQVGFVETWPKKAWRVIKELVGIAKIAKP